MRHEATSVQLLDMNRTNAAPWITLLCVSVIGETVAFVFAIIFGVSAFGKTDAAERSRLWGSAGWWLLGSAACTVVSVWSLVRLLRIIAEQAPRASSETSAS